ncbi:MAG TPA: DUF1549 domain-containing protein [Pirellulales bacterium]|jgi:hypothetical protein|nr:DUF1549 domain-containing protein [Pirellulales bacterium]
MLCARFVLLAGLLAIPSALHAAEHERLVLLPEKFTLSDAEARERILVERQHDGQFVGQVTEGVEFSSSNPKVVVVEDGIARPVGNGTATITAKAGDRQATAEITVVGLDKPFRWSFRNHVESVMAKAGCSTGPCHGAQAGKGGFKISLLGYDPEGDYQVITRQARGRRIVPSDPGRSLVLTKPTSMLPHKGGTRFKPDSLEYRVLSEWIAADTPAPQANDTRIVRIEILPEATVLEPGDNQQLVVRAHFTDGHTEDVTRWARYTSTNESVAQVGDTGGVKIVGHGEGAITAWYLSKVVIATVTAPYKQKVDPKIFASAPRRNFIDEQVLDKLEALNIPPSPECNDHEFIRRATLDTIGMLPTADEAAAFAADRSPDKRDRLIESLLARPEFVDFWTYQWADLLLVNSEKLKSRAAEGGDPRSTQMWAYYSWIRRHVEADTPWDVMVRELVTARGHTLENGAANFFVLHKDPLDLAETTTVAFLGMSINCARCHNHPLEKWTNNQYYAMANLYARVRTKQSPGDGAIIFAATDGDLVQPLTGKPQPPTPLDGAVMPIDSPADRREHLAAWLTAPENPYFARSITNRVWANYLGVGLVEMVDDMRLTNPASNEKLLTAAANYLVEHKFDLKSLMRTVLQSHTYQRSSKPLPANAQDRRFYSRYYPKRLMAEVMLDAVSQVTGKPTDFPGYPTGWRALQLPDSMVVSYFLQAFGRPERDVTCECERSSEPSMVQVLHISNGNTLNTKLQAKGNVIDRWLDAKTPPEKIVDEAYLSALSRQPTERERREMASIIAAASDAERRLVLEDMLWGLLSSKEFLFNH